MQPDDRSALDELSYITTWSEAHGGQADCLPQLLTAFVAEQVDRVNVVQLVDNNPWLEDAVSSNDDIPDSKADDSPGVSLQVPPERAKSWWRVGGELVAAKRSRVELAADEADKCNRQLNIVAWYTGVVMIAVLVGAFLLLAFWGMNTSFDVINNDKRLVFLHLTLAQPRPVSSRSVSFL